MILENDDERKAFQYICELAGTATDRICNDLDDDDRDTFKNLKIEIDDGGKTIIEAPKMDFQIIWWLRQQVKK
jgi:hypothetical protein